MERVELFRNKYRIKSTRMPGWDYRNSGYYFVTLCADNRVCLFGKIKNGEMTLNEYGKILEHEWEITGKKRGNIDLDEYIIMPNHFHSIVQIHEINNYHYCRDVARNVSTIQRNISTTSSISPPAGSLSVIIRAFKSATTKQIHGMGYSGHIWQSRFYEHIIRNEAELNKIRNYICNNPLNWESDDYYVPPPEKPK